MNYDIPLSFLQKLLKNLHISSCIITEPSKNISPEIDLGLRENLFGISNYSLFLTNSMGQAKNNTIYRFFDEYNCTYIFLRLPNTCKETYFFIGPYLLDTPSKDQIDAKADILSLTVEQRKKMFLYYNSLPILEDENILLTMANTLADELWNTSETYSMEYIDYKIPDQYEPIQTDFIFNDSNEHIADLSFLEQNYTNEGLLMDAVSKGKLHQVTAVASSIMNNGVNPYFQDSLRHRKNNLIILKTLLRKAAEYGGVHPLHIHTLSSGFSHKIEQLHTIKQCLKLQEEMIRSYCQLVKKHSLTRFSYYVGQTITIVQYDLTADLSLKKIAEKLNVNPSYLSSLFHKEYGCTLTEFINKQRIDNGIMLLQTTQKTVQEIAADCGIQDVNYFIKLFKKHTGFTPNQYRNKL